MILEKVTVSKKSFESDDPYEIIQSNIDFLNSLFQEHVRYEEVCIDSLKSYHVDYYVAQVKNGGFSQFVYNSNWEPSMVELIVEGLRDMGATKNLKLFQKSKKIVSGMSPKNFERFLDGEYFGNFLQINHLNKFDDRFFKLQESEDLIEFNARWLKSLKTLSVLNKEQLDNQLKHLLEAIPDKEERVKAALASEPRYKKIMRALCKAAGQELNFETAASPVEVEGVNTYAFHFITNEGHHHMVDVNNKGIMFKGHTNEVVVEIEVGDEYGA